MKRLYVIPTRVGDPLLTIDEATRKMTAALRQARIGTCWRGWHTCICHAHSHTCDYVLPDGDETNSLAIHYLAAHRSEVPQADIDYALKLNCGEAEPTDDEIYGRWRRA